MSLVPVLVTAQALAWDAHRHVRNWDPAHGPRPTNAAELWPRLRDLDQLGWLAKAQPVIDALDAAGLIARK